MEVFAFLFLALLVESVITTVRNIFGNFAENKWQIGAIALAAGLSAAIGLDLFALVGVPLQVGGAGGVVIASLATGFVAGRGANALNDFLAGLQANRE